MSVWIEHKDKTSEHFELVKTEEIEPLEDFDWHPGYPWTKRVYVITNPRWNKKLLTQPECRETFRTYFRDELLQPYAGTYYNHEICKGKKSNCFYVEVINY